MTCQLPNAAKCGCSDFLPLSESQVDVIVIVEPLQSQSTSSPLASASGEQPANHKGAGCSMPEPQWWWEEGQKSLSRLSEGT